MPWQQILLLSMPNAAIAFTVTEEVLRAIAKLDEGEERVSWRVGIVRVLLWPLDGLCIGGNLPSSTVRPMVGIRLLPHRSRPRLVERSSMDLALLANA